MNSKQDSPGCGLKKSTHKKYTKCTKCKKYFTQLVKLKVIFYKWVPYSQRYLFNAKFDSNHDTKLNPTNSNRISKQ